MIIPVHKEDDFTDEFSPMEDKLIKSPDDILYEHPIEEDTDQFIGCKVTNFWKKLRNNGNEISMEC